MMMYDSRSSALTSVTDVARVELSCGSFDALWARRFASRFPPHFHDTYAIGVIESGAVRLRTPRGEWIARGGTILAFAPGEVHSAEPLGPGGWTYRMLYPDLRLMREIGVVRGEGATLAEGADAPRFALPVIPDPALGGVLLDAYRPFMERDPGPSAEARLVEALRALGATYASPSARANGDSDAVRAVEVARDFLRSQVAAPVRLSTVADRCGVSQFHLIRVFRRILGVTPYAYLVQLRINQAQAMLHDQLSVAEVAYACGFSDQSHLTRVFKKAVGVPPGKFVRSIRRRPSDAVAR